MILKVSNHDFEYDMKNLCTVFFPFEKIRQAGDDEISVETKKTGDTFSVYAKAFGRSVEKVHILKNGEDEATAMSVLLYTTLSELTNFYPEWGILFGVRPAKLMHRFYEKMGEQGARDYFEKVFLVSKEKTDLAVNVMKHENKIIALSRKNSFSLYISIPFCPTRCSYCSFVSHSIERTKKLIKPYIALLIEEIKETSKIADALGLRLETVYFGGGTPTSLDADDLKRLLDAVESHFDLSTVREYTVEAGRPDTITQDKLLVLKNAGVGRISINPQSFNDRVLETIGRHHTAHQTAEAFDLARKCGFDNINMDLIAGLPGDDTDSFENSISTAMDMGAESITVHTLALKSSSYMATRDKDFDFKNRFVACRMVNYANMVLDENGYHPYYMYRQSKSVGNLENVGWCKKNKDCLYNVFMMDETHTVLSVGAGAVIKLKNQNTGRIERIYNYKYPYEYIDHFDRILSRKKGIMDFFCE